MIPNETQEKSEDLSRRVSLILQRVESESGRLPAKEVGEYVHLAEGLFERTGTQERNP